MISAYQHNQPLTQQQEQQQEYKPLINAVSNIASLQKQAASTLTKVAGDKSYDAAQVLSGVGKTLTDTVSSVQQDMVAAATDGALSNPKYNQINGDSVNKQKKDKDNAGNILEMIFKIVPIGMGIVRRLPNVVLGIKDMAIGFTKLVAGLAVSSIQIFVDSFQFASYAFTYAFSWIGCFIDKVLKIFGMCGVIYLLDFFLFFLYALIFSICFTLDMLLMLKALFGFGLLDALSLISDTLSDIDDRVFAMTSIHLFSYPDWINKACHRCDIDEEPGLTRTSKKIKYDFGTMLPKNVFKPTSQVGGGMAKVLSIFAL